MDIKEFGMQNRDILTLVILGACAALLCRSLFGLFKKDKIHRKLNRVWEAVTICVLGALVALYLNTMRTFSSVHEFDYASVPVYTESAAVTVNDGLPFFYREDLEQEPFTSYGALDSLGRCTAAYALIGPEDLPDEEREDISGVILSGWQVYRYPFISGEFLWHRCHLIAFELTGENANARNLITGSQYMNFMGMQSYENETASYIRRTGNHVLYRVTPVFEGNELVCRGVLMEAMSVEDDDLVFCVYCYNVQPGVTIRYADGTSQAE